MTGCSASNLAFEMSAKDAVGTWTASDDFVTVLVLNENGSLTATEWPTAPGCDGSSAEDIASLRAAERVNISGEWEANETRPYELVLHFSAETCSTYGTYTHVWRRADGKLDICVIIPSEGDPYPLTVDQRFVLHKDPAADPEVRSCP